MTIHGTCPSAKDAAGYVMDTLAADEASAFERHLPACTQCSHLVRRLRESVELLQEATVAVAPPPEIRERLMATVREEARLFDAAEADDGEVPDQRRRPNRLVLGLAATALLGVGALAGATLDSEEPRGQRPPQVERFRGSVTADGGGPRAKVAVVMREGVAQLVLSDLEPPPEGRVYQAWVVRRPSVPTPTGSLFSVPRTGDTVVSLPDLKGVERVIVSDEPPQGSRRPTPPPVAEVLIGE